MNHYQHGHVRFRKRKNGATCWEFMWREQNPLGKRVRRTAMIGTIEDYPTKELAQAGVNGLRMRINEERNRKLNYAIKVSDLIDHYLITELSRDEMHYSHATRIIYREFLIRWIKQRWGNLYLTDVRTIAVETWLRELRRRDGEELANSTKAKIRNVMSVLFNHAIRYEWLLRNPITLVRQSDSEDQFRLYWNLTRFSVYWLNSTTLFELWSCWMSLRGYAAVSCLL